MEQATTASDQGTWMVVEVMGHRKHFGRVTEVTRFGATFMRVEALNPDGSFTELHYGGSAIFGYHTTTEEKAREAVLPRSWMPCDGFKQPSAIAGRCAGCGLTEEAHRAAPQLPAAERESDDGDHEEPGGGGDYDLPL